MDIPKNEFKAAIAARRRQIGLWVTLPSGFTAEALATCGYDWLLFDTEHSVGDPISVFGQLQAAAPYPVSALVRPAANDPVLIKRILDAGAQSLIVPYVQTADQARAAVAAVRYAPQGMRGLAGVSRATRYGLIADYPARAADEICLIVQIETTAAVEQIEAIAAVDGIDGLFVGPADLSATMGLAGQLAHPDVMARVEEAITRIHAAGKPAGLLMQDPAFARRCMALGACFVGVDIDAAILVRGAKSVMAGFAPDRD